MTVFNMTAINSMYIIPGSTQYTLQVGIYTAIDLDTLDRVSLNSIQKDLGYFISSTDDSGLRTYLANKTISGEIGAESIQDLIAATLLNSVYDDEANTILVGGSGINYMGEISLAPEINYYNVQNFTDIGCSTVVNSDGSITTTPDDPLVTIPNLNNALGIGTGFIVLAKDIVIPSVTQNEMSFIWPDLSLDVTGGTYFYVMICRFSIIVKC